MHFEFLVEDSSGAALLEIIVPQLIGDSGADHTWRVHPYKGIGRLPTGLKPGTDASKRILLDQLPRLLRGFAKTAHVDKVIVVIDADDRPCAAFLAELKQKALECGAEAKTLFRLAIEEIEAWYLGDPTAIRSAYAHANAAVLRSYGQDTVCGTWETLLAATHPSLAAAIKKDGYAAVGGIKHEWADKIGNAMDVENNASPSFQKLRDGVRRLVAATP